MHTLMELMQTPLEITAMYLVMAPLDQEGMLMHLVKMQVPQEKMPTPSVMKHQLTPPTRMPLDINRKH